MEEIFREVSQHIALALEAISVLMIAIGAVEALVRIIAPLLRNMASQGRRRAAWLSLVLWRSLCSRASSGANFCNVSSCQPPANRSALKLRPVCSYWLFNSAMASRTAWRSSLPAA